MRLEGIHHVTAITGDVLRNVDFYARVLGLRLVAKSVNQDDPTAYHVFFSDEHGSPGADLTFFEYPDAARGRAGSGMVHRVLWRVASEAAIGCLPGTHDWAFRSILSCCSGTRPLICFKRRTSKRTGRSTSSA